MKSFNPIYLDKFYGDDANNRKLQREDIATTFKIHLKTQIHNAVSI